VNAGISMCCGAHLGGAQRLVLACLRHPP
jgi:hypothetical protein